MGLVIKMYPNPMVAGGKKSMPPPRSLVVSNTTKMNTTPITRRNVTVPPLVLSALAASLFTSPYTSEMSCASTTSNSDTAFVKKTISSHDIVIFSKSYCQYCKRAKAVFKELNQSPHIIELDERDDGQSLQDALNEIVGRRTVPQVFVIGKHIGGSDDTVEAYKRGELARLLRVAQDEP